MSANVWSEEVCTGLVEELKNCVTVKDATGNKIPLADKAVTVRVPEVEFKSEVYPCVSVFVRTDKFDPKRYNPNPVVMNLNYEKKQVEFEEPAVPMNLEVQIDFWSEYQSDKDAMTQSWLIKHFRQFNLKVIDDGGVIRSCNCLKKTSAPNADLISGGKRLFHSVIIYQIWVELDNETRYNVPMVVDRNIDAKSKF